MEMLTRVEPSGARVAVTREMGMEVEVGLNWEASSRRWVSRVSRAWAGPRGWLLEESGAGLGAVMIEV